MRDSAISKNTFRELKRSYSKEISIFSYDHLIRRLIVMTGTTCVYA